MCPSTPRSLRGPLPRPERAALRPPAARLARGGVSWVTLLFIVLFVGGGYLAWTWVPVYVVHYEVKQVVRDYMNQAVKNTNDAALVEKMLHKLRSLDEMDAPDDSGEIVTGPTVQVDPQELTWERDTTVTPPTLSVSFCYTRPVLYPLLQRWTSQTLCIELENDLEHANWGPTR